MYLLAAWITDAGLLLVAVALALWMAGAIYFDVCQASRLGRWLAAGWLAGVAGLLAVWQPLWHPCLAVVVVGALFLLGWLRLQPSHDRQWEASVAVLPRATVQGDQVRFENVRNFQYRTLDDFIPRYETRTVHTSRLQGLDIIFFNWGSRWMSHPVMVFDFGADGRICVSIEVRYRRGQAYSVWRSLYRQQELIFVVADERDVILRRTKYGPPQEARLYRLRTSPAERQTVLLDYVGEINDLYQRPRWYHGVCANCTTSFYRLPHSRVRWDWRVIANNRLAEALYHDGRLDQTLPFAELRRLALITDIANQAPERDFGDYLRQEVEGRRHAG